MVSKISLDTKCFPVSLIARRKSLELIYTWVGDSINVKWSVNRWLAADGVVDHRNKVAIQVPIKSAYAWLAMVVKMSTDNTKSKSKNHENFDA